MNYIKSKLGRKRIFFQGRIRMRIQLYLEGRIKISFFSQDNVKVIRILNMRVAHKTSIFMKVILMYKILDMNDKGTVKQR